MNSPFHLITAANGVGYIACQALTAPHGFSTRLGGSSQGAFASLNLGVSAGDVETVVRGNRAEWANALGLEGPIAGMHQVHGGDVHVVAERPTATLYGDALAANRPGLPIGVYTADCTPILLHDPDTGAVSAIHAGWRGTVAQIAASAVRTLIEHFGARPDQIVAAVGPAIGPCCFEVGTEVVDAIVASGWAGHERAIVPARPGGKPHVDLWEANRSQLAAAGLRPENIHVAGLCTACRADWFYSWRRDHGATGRMQAAIASPGPAR